VRDQAAFVKSHPLACRTAQIPWRASATLRASRSRALPIPNSTVQGTLQSSNGRAGALPEQAAQGGARSLVRKRLRVGVP
jgi:hypothetical protein